MPNNVLIVDDEVELTKILGEYFHVKKGYNVLTATDGKVALNVIREQTPELVLLDMKLPSVNGLEILKTLRKDYPGTKVIVMTAYDNEYKIEIDAVGYDAFFIKPILFEELKDTVDALLSGTIPREPKPAPYAVPVSKQAPAAIDKENYLPKARIAIIEIRGSIAMLLKSYLEQGITDSKYSALLLKSGTLYFNEVEKFRPDIVLYDIVEIGSFSEFAQKLTNLPSPPKEIILFGDPKFKWEEVDTLTKRGMSYIPTPLAASKARLANDPEFEFPVKETIERLAQVIEGVCFKHGLIIKKGV